jgi:hypothetical protein
MLVRHEDVDMFEMDRVAQILGGAVEWLLHGGGSGCGLPHILVQLKALIQPRTVGWDGGQAGWRAQKTPTKTVQIAILRGFWLDFQILSTNRIKRRAEETKWQYR